MNKIFDYIDYAVGILNAIAKGLKAVSDNWPRVSPFGDGASKRPNGVESESAHIVK